MKFFSQIICLIAKRLKVALALAFSMRIEQFTEVETNRFVPSPKFNLMFSRASHSRCSIMKAKPKKCCNGIVCRSLRATLDYMQLRSSSWPVSSSTVKRCATAEQMWMNSLRAVSVCVPFSSRAPELAHFRRRCASAPSNTYRFNWIIQILKFNAQTKGSSFQSQISLSR